MTKLCPPHAPGRCVLVIGLGLVREATPQPMDRRATAEARRDLVCGSDRGDESQGQAGPVMNAIRPARSARGRVCRSDVLVQGPCALSKPTDALESDLEVGTEQVLAKKEKSR